MDFFEAQDQAHARSKWLIIYFVAAIVMIVMAVYAAVTAGFFYYESKVGSELPVAFFSAKRFGVTIACVVPVIVLGSLFRIAQLKSMGGAGVAQSLGGRQLSLATRRPDERKLLNIVEEMSIASGVPMPAVFVMEHESGVNAFAAGFNIEAAVIGVTQGAIEQLDRDELQGVVAHEFSHILNGDMRLNTKLSGWIYGIVMLTILGRGFWHLIKGSDSGYSGRYYGRRRRISSGGGSSDSKGGAGALILAIVLVAVLITLIGFIGEFFARLIQAAVSRQREYLADASAVQFTRNPDGIGNALRRIGGIPRFSVMEHPSTSEFAHSFFAKSLTSEVSFLSTHPPLQRRIQRVLHNWDGQFLAPRPKPKAKRVAPKTKKSERMNVAKAMNQQGGGPGKLQDMLTAGLFMRHLGQLKESSLAYAEKVRLKLEADWPDVLEAADRSPGFLLALLFHEEDEIAAQQLTQLKAVFPDRVDRVESYGRKFRSLGRSQRLLLLEILAARLETTLTESEYDDYLRCVEAFVEVDGQVFPFEVACLQIVKRKLFSDSETAPRRQDSSVVAEAAGVLASRLLVEGGLDEKQGRVIIVSAAKSAPYFMNQLSWTEVSDAETLNAAFVALSRTPFGIRKQFLEVCERIVAADQKVTINEVELLRAIAVGIGVPAAPILPSEEGTAA